MKNSDESFWNSMEEAMYIGGKSLFLIEFKTPSISGNIYNLLCST